MTSKKIPLCANSLAVLALAAFALPQDPATEQDLIDTKIHRMLELTGAADLGKSTMDQMLEAFESNPGLPAGFISKFQEMVQPSDLVDLVVPIYRRHLDEETIDAMIAFALTPEGKKCYAAQPEILRDSLEVGMKWGQEAAMKAMQELGR